MENASKGNTGWVRWALGALCLAGILALLLFFFDPAKYAFYPRCWFKVSTGLDCPGCGALRATHQLLHGNVAGAFQLNPMIVTLLAAAAAAFLVYLCRPQFVMRFAAFVRTKTFVVLAAALLAAFAVLRNLPADAVWLFAR